MTETDDLTIRLSRAEIGALLGAARIAVEDARLFLARADPWIGAATRAEQQAIIDLRERAIARLRDQLAAGGGAGKGGEHG